MHTGLFFDNARLYAHFYPGGATKSLLLCYPGPHEMMRMHWAYHQFALRMMRAGWNVMKWDYFGTGDSQGGDADFAYDQAVRDISLAAHELQTRARGELHVFAMRAGAGLVARARLQAQSVFFCDAVFDFATYHAELRLLQRKLFDESRFPLEHAFAPEDLLGYRGGALHDVCVDPPRHHSVSGLDAYDWRTHLGIEEVHLARKSFAAAAEFFLTGARHD